MMNLPTIAMIGGGNMGSSLIGGLIKHGHPAKSLYVSDTNEQKLAALQHKYGVHISTDNAEIAAAADVIIFAIKPQLMAETIKPLASKLHSKQLLISIAAGVPAESITHWAGGEFAVVRAMPNTPALHSVGATGLYANSHVTAQQRDIATAIMQAVGLAIWVDNESQIDIVTAISGSGPAYFFLMMEALTNAAIEFGLPAETANALARQTALGAATMAVEDQTVLQQLRTNVTSPGGTTEQAILTMEKNNFRDLIKQTVAAAKSRSEELAKQYGDK